MSFKVTITETKSMRRIKPKEWTKVDSEEVARDNQWLISESEPKTRIKDVYGYTPEVETVTIDTVQIYEQVVHEMDLPSVIKAINGM